MATEEPTIKLSNKQRRLLKKQEESAKVDADLAAREANEDGLAQFSSSQQASAEAAAARSMSDDIIIDQFSISAAGVRIFEDASLQIVAGRRYGLVGPNGHGKTTLIKHIAHRQLAIPEKIDILCVEQEVVADNTPALHVVLNADKATMEVLSGIQEMEERQRQCEAPGSTLEWTDVDDERLAKLYAQSADLGAESAKPRAQMILAGLGFEPSDQLKATKHFSGGWRMRISLARALFMQPTLLLLDEPTNHLDLNAVIWLDEYLCHWKKTLIVVSHDQDFLNSVSTDIISVENKKLIYHKGDYYSFAQHREQRRTEERKQYEKWDKADKQRKAASKPKAASGARGKAEAETGKKAVKGTGSKGGGGGAQVIKKVDRPKEYLVKFTFGEAPQLDPPFIGVNDAAFHYPGGPVLFRNLNFGIHPSSRIAIVGPNGVGKSTLLNLIIGQLQPTDGEIRINQRLRLGIYGQHFVDRLPMNESACEYIDRLFGGEELPAQKIRGVLGRFGLPGSAHTIKIRDLSGGQKARVVFAELSLKKAHVLVMDEPTNNLDIESIDALCLAIREFQGGVVLVSHDARLIQEAECDLWVCGKQTVKPFNGDFDAYRESVLQEQQALVAAGETAQAVAREKRAALLSKAGAADK
eukprot:TRINITY_DN166_c0_g1_i1.p1 TRINITY_DN166_c0_g1~~TRINITY_DN166_c0_g1_i1.p1  ORF type:complete len:651 (-),score=148.77 TRINITY_DN166_c0_g1_i1:781-2700(-)